MVGQPRAASDLLELYIKVCESVTERLGERDFERKEREMWKWKGMHWRHTHTNHVRLINCNSSITVIDFVVQSDIDMSPKLNKCYWKHYLQ